MPKYEVLYTVLDEYVTIVDADTEDEAGAIATAAVQGAGRVLRADTGIITSTRTHTSIEIEYILEADDA